ncbi:hypothetical protein [Desulfosporosinus burensis]
MSNQWGSMPRVKKRQSIGKLVSVIVLIGIIAYQFFPKFINKMYSVINPTYAATNSNNYSLPNTNNSSALKSPTYSIQNSPSTYNISSDKKSEVTTGYWLLFVVNGQMSQLSADVETTTFIRQLIESDRKSTGNNTLFLVENGRFRQYMVSNEIYSVVSNLSVIDARVSKGSTNSNLNSSVNSSLNASGNLDVPKNLSPNNSVNSSSSAPSSANQPYNSSTNTSPNTSINSSSNIPNNSVK